MTRLSLSLRLREVEGGELGGQEAPNHEVEAFLGGQSDAHPIIRILSTGSILCWLIWEDRAQLEQEIHLGTRCASTATGAWMCSWIGILVTGLRFTSRCLST